jgi:DNA-binding NarL/FixJ family response regulator
MSIQVSIVEDDPVTRENLKAIINRSDELDCLHAYATAEDALRRVPKEMPDVLLLDINLGRRSGIECVAVLKAAHPKLQMLMVTTYDDTKLIFDALRAGASGYLLKRTPAAEIVAAIKEVHEGGSPMSAQIARKVVSYFHPDRALPHDMETLTAREHEILNLLAKGMQYKEIADHLTISTSTVRGHLHLIYGKLHVQSRTEAVLKYLGR